MDMFVYIKHHPPAYNFQTFILKTWILRKKAELKIGCLAMGVFEVHKPRCS